MALWRVASTVETWVEQKVGNWAANLVVCWGVNWAVEMALTMAVHSVELKAVSMELR
jgi:hypothetical protein